MNKPRRKQIEEVINNLVSLQEEVNNLITDVETIHDEEEEYRDNMPENLQGSERYEKAESACEALESARDTLEEITSSIDDIISNLEEASE